MVHRVKVNRNTHSSDLVFHTQEFVYHLYTIKFEKKFMTNHWGEGMKSPSHSTAIYEESKYSVKCIIDT